MGVHMLRDQLNRMCYKRRSLIMQTRDGEYRSRQPVRCAGVRASRQRSGVPAQQEADSSLAFFCDEAIVNHAG